MTNQINRINQKASPALTLLFSILPGAGHMYLGLMKRGLELMIAFLAAFFIVADLLHLAEIGVPLCIVIFFYSLFDAQHLNKAIRKGEEVADYNNLVFLSKINLNGYHMGIAAMALGFILLLDRLRGYMVYFIPSAAYSIVERSIVPLLIIVLGFLLMKNASGGSDIIPKKE